MSLSPVAQISLPLDLPNVDVMSTRQTKVGQYVIVVVSRSDEVTCGICHQTIHCNYGCGSPIRLRHLPLLGLQTIIEIRPKRGQCATLTD